MIVRATQVGALIATPIAALIVIKMGRTASKGKTVQASPSGGGETLADGAAAVIQSKAGGPLESNQHSIGTPEEEIT